MRKKRNIQNLASIVMSVFMMCSLLNFGQIVVKASTPQEEDNTPGILEIDDFDSRAEYDKYMNRLHTFKDYQYKIEKVKGEKNGYRINVKRYTGFEKKHFCAV